MKYSHFGYTDRLRSAARALRKNMTPQEKHLWYDFLKNYPVKFYRQRPICGYIVDFFCVRARLIIELDGSQHYTEDGEEYDTIRTEILNENGLTVLRFTNPQVNREFESVCMAIDNNIKALTGE